MSTRTSAGSTLGVAVPDARSYIAWALANPTVMVTIGSVDGCPLISGVGSSLMTTAAVLAAEVTVPAAAVTDESEPPALMSSVLLLNTLSTSELRASPGTALVIGCSSCVSCCPTGTCERTVLAARPTDATDADPVATGFLAEIDALVCEQASPTEMKALTASGNAVGAHVCGCDCDVPS